ncbi:MAG: glycosyltransferase family 2 protein [Clostridiales bacterium]|nr:glycosyltransferase family 2 protein [Clostridiales bacterium]MBR5417744.1 glycosyltransferase family 2 protein [Clostridiales bacterium]
MLVSLMVPCYNEEEALPFLYEALCKVMDECSKYEYELIFVNDGSRDKTLSVLKDMAEKDSRVRYISFSRNFGKEAAMYAGLSAAKGEWIGLLDADMQDPPSLLPEMFQALENDECDIIATRRVSRKGEPPIRSWFARRFYHLINKFTDVEIVDGARDFRVMKRPVVDAILSLGERQRFSKGIFAWVGFRTKWLEYENVERVAGETKWSFWKLFRYAIEGIVSFTTAPLRIAMIVGFLTSLGAFVYLVYYFIHALIYQTWEKAAGYPSLLSFMLFLGGMILMALGIIGEYLAKTYIEVKKRPLYIIGEDNLEKKD